MGNLEYSETFAQISSPKNIHNCKLCPYFTKSCFLMVNHIRRHRSSMTLFNCETTTVENYYCKDCNVETELTITFKQHISDCHYNKTKLGENASDEFIVQKYSCDQCNFDTHFLVEWLRHQHTKQIVGGLTNSLQYVENSEHLDNDVPTWFCTVVLLCQVSIQAYATK